MSAIALASDWRSGVRRSIPPQVARTTADVVAGQSPAPLILTAMACAGVIALARLQWADAMLAEAAALAGVCLVLWLTEVIPLYATTLVLWVGMVVVLGRIDPVAFSLSRVLAAVTNPVMVLFFGGFVLSVAGAKYGIDSWLASRMIRAAGGQKRRLLLSMMGLTAVLSMWMLNTAAAAMMLVALRPLFAQASGDRSFRIAMLLGLAIAANLGGIGTPIGTGPNLIAIGAIESRYNVDFLDWMAFGVPTAVIMLTIAYLLLIRLYRVSGTFGRYAAPARVLPRGAPWVIAVFCATVLAWLLEPLHHVPAALVAVAMTAVLFGTKLLDADDLRRIGWDTLLLIAGGITLGQLLGDSGLARALTASVAWHAWHPTAVLFGLIFTCAIISAVSSNTAAAVVVIQIAMSIAPSTATPVLVALGASMGMPFVISTPPNAMAYGEGGLRPRDFFIPGSILMIVGCLLIALAGPAVLRWLGFPS